MVKRHHRLSAGRQTSTSGVTYNAVTTVNTAESYT